MAKAKRRKKTVKKRVVKARKRPARRKARRPAGLTGVIDGLAKARADLVAQRDALDEQIAALDGAMAAMGAVRPARKTAGRPVARRIVRRRRGTRARRAGSLKEFIAKAMAGHRGALAVKDITAAVLKSGYKTKNKTLAKSVGIALTQMREVAKVRRGLFKMK